MTLITTDSLRLRLEPNTNSTVLKVLPVGTRLQELPIATESANNLTWQAVYLPSAKLMGWCATRWLRPGQPTPQPKRSTFGLHYYPYGGADIGALYALAGEGLLRGVTVVNDYNVANNLVDLNVPYVVFRAGVDSTEYRPTLTGTSSDVDIGKAWFYHSRYWVDNQKTDPRVILQVGNEFGLDESLPMYDNYFWEGVLQAADAEGRIMCIFNDFCGTPKMWFDRDGYHSPVWQKRERVLRACLVDQAGNQRTKPHFVGIHAYSKPGPNLASDPVEWEWGAGYWRGLYSTTPQYQPPLLLTEYGSHDADVERMPEGLQSVVKDVADSLPLLAGYPVVKAFMYWTMGGWNKSKIDAALPALRLVVRDFING
ncbi:hypothetical protein FBQ95_17030 [Chloroflexi bacterium CFX3]|nr:hypothetical protein [Chloroflexi bacterium CFX3]